ncbi:MAG TPA: glycosyl hydrolase [Vicinamibacteria bacterium]|nr:glycosyl hydrolase [Vicinamibacteria bacterium]
MIGTADDATPTEATQDLPAAAPWAGRAAAILALLALLPIGSAALDGPETARSPLEKEMARALSFRLVGPYRGGRVVAVAGVPSSPRTFYMGSTGGGVWRTTDGGAAWTNVSDGFFGSASIGALAVALSDPNVVYAGTGETCLRNNISAGDGIYRSDDAGRTWRHAGLPDAGQIGKVRIHPRDPDLVYVAVLGHAFGPSSERGVYRTRDGGRSWQRVLFVTNTAGAVDVSMDPSNPRVLYAATWEVVRKPWTLVSGGPGSGIHKSTDGGDTWTRLQSGLPAGVMGKIGVAVSPADPQRVWALVEAAPGEGGLYRSDDGGASFRLINKDKRLLTRPFYYMHLEPHPTDRDVLFCPAHGRWMLRSADGGQSFSVMPGGGDNHALWMSPRDPAIMILGDDGGARVTFDGGKSWSPQDNQPTAEIYSLALDNGFPWRLYGAQQDSGTISVPSRTSRSGIELRDCYPVGGGEHGDIAVDPRDPNIVYAGNYEGILERYDHRTGQTRRINVYPQYGEGVASRNYRYRFAIIAPVRVSAHDPSILYHASQFVHRSHDEGQSWEIASPDLSRNDKTKQDESGGPITRDHTGPEVYGAIVALEESPLARGILWAGTDDGLVHISRDDGKSWTNVTPRDLPEWGSVNRIEPSHHAPGRAFLAVHRYRLDDFAPYVFRTDDFGRSWVRIADGRNGIPARHFVRVVREDPEHKGLLYAGTEYGLYVSLDDGRTWQRFQLNLPVTAVTDIQIRDRDLAVSTMGRSFWVLDDLTPLHTRAQGALGTEARLLRPRDTLRMAGSSSQESPSERPAQGRNPPSGALVDYVLPGNAVDEVRLEFRDAAGVLVRAVSSKDSRERRPSAQVGLQRFVWDLRQEAPKVPPTSFHAKGLEGPIVPPGVYEARLRVGALERSERFEVRKDPRLATTLDDFREQSALALEIRDRLSRLFAAHGRSQALRTQLKALFEGPSTGSGPPLQAAAKTLSEALLAIEADLIDPRIELPIEVIHFGPKLDFELLDLYGTVEEAEARPTEGMKARFRDLDAALMATLGRFRPLGAQVDGVNRLVRENGLPLPALEEPR